jgi:hypothetical protein
VDEQRLWAAVLLQAIKDLAGFNEETERDRLRLRYFARLWFTSDNHQPCSFLWICDQLELSPSWIRKMIAPMDAGIVTREDVGVRVSVARARGILFAVDDHD